MCSMIICGLTEWQSPIFEDLTVFVKPVPFSWVNFDWMSPLRGGPSQLDSIGFDYWRLTSPASRALCDHAYESKVLKRVRFWPKIKHLDLFSLTVLEIFGVVRSAILFPQFGMKYNTFRCFFPCKIYFAASLWKPFTSSEKVTRPLNLENLAFGDAV